MTENLVGIDVLSLLQFFDEVVPASCYHATAVVAVAGEDMGAGLVAHYLRQQGLTVESFQNAFQALAAEFALIDGFAQSTMEMPLTTK